MIDQKVDVLVIGETLMIDHGDGESGGGAGAQVARAAALLGKQVGLLTCLSEDNRGRRLRSWLADAGVQVHRSLISHTPRAEWGNDIEASPGPQVWRFAARRLPMAGIIHVTSLPAGVYPASHDVLGLFAANKGKSLRSVAILSRYLLALRKEAILTIIAASDVVITDRVALEWLYPDRAIEDAVALLLNHRAGIVFVVDQSAAWVFTESLSIPVLLHETQQKRRGVHQEAVIGHLLDEMITRGFSAQGGRRALLTADPKTLRSILKCSIRAAAAAVTTG